ncbi:MAG: BREX-1 system phosphatase PglZ type A [Micrococcales bacterium]|nr:BREX-1 system phosphatase PglZ type A [Micrococcales bacterium]
MIALASIQAQLQQRFAGADPTSRLVIWSDPEGEFKSQLDQFDLPGVTVLRVDSDEFAIKVQVLSEEPAAKFLIYRAGPPPATNLDNWLLDLELTYGLFTADREALLSQDLGVPAELVEHYPAFFNSDKRNTKLGQRVSAEDSAKVATAKMVATVIGCEDHSLDMIWRHLLQEHAAGRSTWINEITKLGLDGYHWAGTKEIYGYSSDAPSVEDFMLWVFGLAWQGFASDVPNQYRNIQRDFSTWSNDLRFTQAYLTLAEMSAVSLRISEQLADLDLPELMERFVFREADQEITTRLAAGVEQRTLLDQDVKDMARSRLAGTWGSVFEHHYLALTAASTCLTRIDLADLSMASPTEGFHQYTEAFFAIDQAYRHFTWHCDQIDSDPTLAALRAKVEGFYTTRFLRPLGDEWQRQVDTLEQWRVEGVTPQRQFFAKHVQGPYLSKGNRIVVLISDGLRYEVAEELCRRIRREDKFEGNLDSVLSTLPSYTQLGMAALLPHETLAFAEDKSAHVAVDGKPSNGTANRGKLLDQCGGAALRCEAFLEQSPSQRRETLKASQVLYLYHDLIDRTGEERATEGGVFDAVERTITDLIRIIKALASANASNILVTADHGFLYQDSGLNESDYLSEKPHGDQVPVINPRFALGLGLLRQPAFTTFTSAQLGLTGRVEAQVPRSIHRLKAGGSGVRYVHGGASLQEVVVPVLAINKKRAKDTDRVAVRPMADTDRITTGQITVHLYQEEPVTEKIRPRELFAALYVEDTMVSNEVCVVCSQTSSEKRDRFHPITLVLSRQADPFNGQTIELRLFETVGTSQRVRYPPTLRFTLNRTFTSDFDF